MPHTLRSFLTVLAGATLLAGAVTLSSAARVAPAAAAGPGGVYQLHLDLLEALDDGDGKAIAGLLADSRRGLTWRDGEWGEQHGFLAFGTTVAGKAVAADTRVEGLELLLDLADADHGKGRPWKTSLVSMWADCPSADISFATLEFERRRAGEGDDAVRRYRATSLVSHTKGKWKLWHIHVSPAG